MESEYYVNEREPESKAKIMKEKTDVITQDSSNLPQYVLWQLCLLKRGDATMNVTKSYSHAETLRK